MLASRWPRVGRVQEAGNPHLASAHHLGRVALVKVKVVVIAVVVKVCRLVV